VYYTVDNSNGSPNWSFENDASSATLDIYIQYEDLNDGKLGFLGYPLVETDEDSSYLSRNIPDWMADVTDSQGNVYLFATKMTAMGIGIPDDVDEVGTHNELTDTPIYEAWKCQINYETLTYDILDDDEMEDAGYVDDYGNPDESYLVRYVTKVVGPSAEYLTLPTGGFSFVVPGFSGAAPVVQGGPGKIVCNFDLSLTWHMIPKSAVPSAVVNPDTENPAIDLSLGKVNDSLWNGFPTGTLLMVGAAIKPIRSTAGDRLYDLEYRFKFLNAQTPTTPPTFVGNEGVYYQGQAANGSTPAVAPGYYEITTTGTTNLTNQTPGQSIYDFVDFDSLFSTYDRSDDEDE
jgi:hypothetical protein